MTEQLNALDNDCTKENPEPIIRDQSHLSRQEQASLLALMQKHEDLFEGKLGTWNCEPADIELKPGSKPFRGKPHRVPQAYLDQTKKECERLVKIGVLRKINESEWSHPTFIVPKKDGKIRWVTDLRELNKQLVRKPCPLPNKKDIWLGSQGFTCAAALDSNMGCCHITLTPNARMLCSIAMPWGKHECLRPPQ